MKVIEAMADAHDDDDVTMSHHAAVVWRTGARTTQHNTTAAQTHQTDTQQCVPVLRWCTSVRRPYYVQYSTIKTDLCFPTYCIQYTHVSLSYTCY
jgi:hypothetical protein